MQIKQFIISIFDTGNGQEELNKFLRGYRVLSIKEELVSNADGGYWCYSIRYLPSSRTGNSKKVDYKEVLDAATFKKFSGLRVCRKKIADDEQLPAFAVFTDAELSKIASLKELTTQKMRAIKGVGEKKVEKYGKLLIDCFNK